MLAAMAAELAYDRQCIRVKEHRVVARSPIEDRVQWTLFECTRFMLLAFRGTASFKELDSLFEAGQTTLEGALGRVSVYAGTLRAHFLARARFCARWLGLHQLGGPRVPESTHGLGRAGFVSDTELPTQGERPVIVTGHGSGGAFATTFFLRHVTAERQLKLITFGAPMCVFANPENSPVCLPLSATLSCGLSACGGN